MGRNLCEIYYVRKKCSDITKIYLNFEGGDKDQNIEVQTGVEIKLIVKPY